MEMTTYAYNTEHVTESDLWCLREMDPMTDKGNVTYVRKCKNWLSLTFGGERHWYLYGDIINKAEEHLTTNDVIEITSWYDWRKKRDLIISFVNHTKNIAVVDQKLMEIMQHNAITKARRHKHHLMLQDAVRCGDLFVLVKKLNHGLDNERYELIDIRSAWGQDSYGTVIDMLQTAGVDSTAERWVKHNTPLGYLREIPKHGEYLFGAFGTNEKKHDCSCGMEPCVDGQRNHSIIAGSYFCEYCFFDRMHIRVPEKFFSEERISA